MPRRTGRGGVFNRRVREETPAARTRTAALVASGESSPPRERPGGGSSQRKGAGRLHGQFSSTARFKAIGAQIGVGGDLSSIGSNPAGIGLFTRSDFSFTPEFNSYSADAQYLNSQTIGKKENIEDFSSSFLGKQQIPGTKQPDTQPLILPSDLN